ncbi:hypothetical protein Sjap_018895 [Stephania japonica]|uniref:Uncharacterized protein n=1 Tax=Stephania japonica TaxID=461633 RepID=A0AAP0I8Z0_9MAGN
MWKILSKQHHMYITNQLKAQNKHIHVPTVRFNSPKPQNIKTNGYIAKYTTK